MGKYDHLERDALVRLLEQRDAECKRLDSDSPFSLKRPQWTS